MHLNTVGISAISAKRTRVKESKVPKHKGKSSLNWFVCSELNRKIAKSTETDAEAGGGIFFDSASFVPSYVILYSVDACF